MIVRDQNPLSRRKSPGPAMGGVLLGPAVLVVALFMTLLPAPADPAGRGPLLLNGPAGIEALSRHFEYRIDPDWQLKAADFADADTLGMLPVPGPVPDFGYTTAKIWLRIRVVNEAGPVDDWRFLVHVAFTQQIAIYRIDPGGAITALLDLTEDSPFGARPIDYPQLAVPFDLAPGEATTLLVSYYALGASRHSMSIETTDSFAARGRTSTAKNHAFYGMMLVLIALACAALVTLRQPVFAAYAGYLSSIFMYIAHADGIAFQYFWPGNPQFNSMAASVAGSGVMVFGGLFAMTFLNTSRHHPAMHRVLLAVVASVLALDLVLWTTDPKLLNRVLVYMILVSVLCFLIAGLVAARTRFREVRFYVFAWGAALIPACLFTARFAFGIEPSFITPYDAIRLALVIDALMMGLAIFDRYNHLRQSAMEETLAHAQRNLALSQRLAMVEQSYEQVTSNARRREESVKDTVHDLRQPMHALRLSIRQMFDPGPDKATDVGQVEAALGYMERLVAERLAVAADADGSDSPASASRNARPALAPTGGGAHAAEPGLHDVLRGIADMFAPEARDKGLELRLVLAAPDAAVAAYPLMRVTANLVSNAIKYTRQGRILIGLRRRGAGFRVEIHDTGPGLSGAAFEQALLRNERLERDRGAAEGSGLGLAVARAVAGANGWTIISCPGRRTGASLCIELSAMSSGSPPGAGLDVEEAGTVDA